MCGDHCATCGKVQDEYHCRQSGDIYCDDCFANRKFREEDEEEDSDDDEEWGQNSEFMCELVDCATCKRPTMRKDMYWKQGGCVMTDLCEPCHKAKIPDDMMVVPRYMFENEKGELVKWCLCVMKL
jgi:recombinational DNA repair protein (RecF pathway)